MKDDNHVDSTLAAVFLVILAVLLVMIFVS